MSTATLTPDAPTGSAPAKVLHDEGRIGLRSNLRHIGALVICSRSSRTRSRCSTRS